MKNVSFAVGFVGLVLGTAVYASTAESWANMDTRVNRACLAMSGLARPSVLARKISTSDTLGVEIRMLRGYDDNNKFQRKVCVFKRSNSRTEVHDAGSWFGSTVTP